MSIEETLRMFFKRSGENRLAPAITCTCGAVMHRCRRHQRKPAVVVLCVVPVEEDLAKRPGVLNTTKSLRKGRPVFERFEMTLRKGIVIANMMTAKSLGYTQVGQKQCHRFRCHRRSSVIVNKQLRFIDSLTRTGLTNEQLSKLSTLSASNHPAHCVAAEYVDDHIEVVIVPLFRSFQLRDVPAPNLVRSCGQQFRLLVLRVAQLIPALSDFSILTQDSVHGAD